MKVNVDKFTEDFQLRSFGAKGWKSSKFFSCPHCGKDYSKFGILLLDKGGVYKCFRCDTAGSIFRLLRLIDRRDLIIYDGEEPFSYKDKLSSLLVASSINEPDLTIDSINLPPGYERINYHPYLEKRGWEPEDYDRFEVGISEALPRFRNRLIFLLREDTRLIGYLSRSLQTKEWHDENLKKYKEKLCPLVLRYDNSTTEFEKVVGGIDDIVEGQTKTVIIVEGLFDKANTDRILGLNRSPEVKCVFTFGCHLSFVQLYKIYEKGVEEIILMFDTETIKQTKTVSLSLSKYFYIFISEIVSGKDPGEMNFDEFQKSLSKLTNPIDYFANRVEKIKLKW